MLAFALILFRSVSIPLASNTPYGKPLLETVRAPTPQGKIMVNRHAYATIPNSYAADATFFHSVSIDHQFHSAQISPGALRIRHGRTLLRIAIGNVTVPRQFKASGKRLPGGIQDSV